MSSRNPVKHHPLKCACTNDAPAFGSRKIIKRTVNDNGRILSAIDTGIKFGHDSITFKGMDND